MVFLGIIPGWPSRRQEDKAWIDEYLADSQNRLQFEEESLIVAVSEQLLHALEHSGRSKAELANQLGTSRANITQLLDGRRNLTLRTLARLAYHLGLRVRTMFTSLDHSQMESIDMPTLDYTNLGVGDTSFDSISEEFAQGMTDEYPALAA